MKIVIVGGGKVGFAIAREVSAEGHDVTIIDSSRAVCQNCGIRSTVSPKDICAQEISRYVRAMESTDAERVLSVYSLLGGRVEALEFLVTADVPHLGESLASVTLQPGILLACISRGAKVIFPGGGDSLQAGDTVIVVAPRERHIAELRQIFAERG